MKARCKCGRIIVFRPELEGKTVRCPGCGKAVRLPSSERPAAPPLKEAPGAAAPRPEREEAVRQGAAEADTEAPTRDEEVAEAPRKAEPEFDWGEEFSLEREEPSPPQARPSAPAAPEEARAPAAPAEESGLGFESREFHLDTEGAAEAEEAPLDLGPGQILGVRKGPAAGPPGGLAVEKIQVCPKCGLVATEKVDACPECGTALGVTGARKAAGRAPAWAASFWGAFGYAYAAVFAANGWKSWLRYLLAGVGAPVLLSLFMRIPILGCLGCFAVPVVLVVMLSAVVGAMYYYMAHSAAYGLESVQEARPQVWGDMVLPFFQVIFSSNLLVIGPIVAGWLVARLTGSIDFAELRDLLEGGEGVSGYAKVGGLVASSALILAGMVIGVFCFPMQLMLLGASQSLGKTANPVNMLKALFRAPLEYAILCAFFMLNIVLTPILVILGALSAAVVAEGPLGPLLVLAVIMGIMIYMASVNGWRMGMFLHSNPKVFDHVK